METIPWNEYVEIMNHAAAVNGGLFDVRSLPDYPLPDYPLTNNSETQE